MAAPSGPFAAPAWAGSQRLGDVGLKATLLILANYADEAYSCYPSQQRVADDTDQSVRTVRRHIELLREIGLIKSERRTDGQGHRTSDRHYLQLDVYATKVDVKAARERLGRDQMRLRVIVSPRDSEVDGGADDAPTGHDMDGRPTGHDLSPWPMGHDLSDRDSECGQPGRLEDTTWPVGLEAKSASLEATAVAEELPDRTPSKEQTQNPAAADATEDDGPALFDLQAQKLPKQPRASKAPKTPDPVREHADRLCRPWWEALTPRPAGKRAYPNAVEVVMTVVDKWTDADITAVLARCGRTVSGGSMNFHYDRIQEERQPVPRRNSGSTTTDRVLQAQSLKRGRTPGIHVAAIGGGQ